MPAARDPEDFPAFIARHGLAAKLRTLHWQRVAVGLGAALAVVAYNLGHRSGDAAAVLAVEVAAALYLPAALAVLVWRQRRLLAALAAAPDGIRAQALAVAEFVNARGAILLGVAAAGHALFLVGSYLQVRLAPDAGGLALAVLLLPTLGLLVHGLAQIPDERMLGALHRRGLASAGRAPASPA